MAKKIACCHTYHAHTVEELSLKSSVLSIFSVSKIGGFGAMEANADEDIDIFGNGLEAMLVWQAPEVTY